MKVALVHDYLREYGGAERVVEVFHEIYPEAPLYTAFIDWKGLGKHAERFRGWDIRPSWVQHFPFIKKFISPLRFLAPKIWGSFDLSDYDVVISSSGWFMCRGVNTNSKFNIQNSKLQLKNQNLVLNSATMNHEPRTNNTLHICYIHHPPRNLYGYATGSDLQKYKIVRIYAAIVNFFLRHYDFETAQKVDYFIANSKETKRRVWKFYRRKSVVVYPPIESKKSKLLPRRQAGKSQNHNSKVKSEKLFYLSVGRLAWAKRVDLTIQACNELKLQLKVVGVGKEEKYLKSIAGPTIEFMGSVSDEHLASLYAEAKALIFSALDEDFGMVPVEAMAHGIPVIGLAQGGVLETVIEAKTGVFFEEPSVKSLTEAIRKFENIKIDWSKESISWAKTFSKERFKREIISYVRKVS